LRTRPESRWVANWRLASPEQRDQLVREFRTLLVRTYSGVLVNYRDQVSSSSLAAQPGDAQVTVRSEVRQSGAQAESIDYEMGEDPIGLEGVHVKISGGVSPTTYRDTFARKIRNRGIEA